MERVTDPADLTRCQAVHPQGQCWIRVEPGSDRCAKHGGENEDLKEDRRQYQLVDAREKVRLAQLADHDEITSLREEIALARRLVERRFNLIKNDTELLVACAPLNQLLLTIERLVKTSHDIEQELGVLLERNTVLQVAQLLCQIVIDEIQHLEGFEPIIDRIAERFTATIRGTNKPAGYLPETR